MSAVNQMQWPTAIDRLVTLHATEVRLELINTYRRASQFATNFSAADVLRLYELDCRVHAAIENDRRLMLSDAHHVEREAMVRDVATLHTVAGKAFVDLLVDRIADDEAADKSISSDQLLRLALHHYSESTKWGFYRHEPVRLAVWQQLHRVFSLIEAAQCENNTCSPYPGDASSETMRSRYIRTLLLDLLNTHNLSAVQNEIADAWLAQWCGTYTLEPRFSADRHRLLVDLEGSAGLELASEPRAGEGVRFVSMPQIGSQLTQLHESLRSGKIYGGPSVEQFPIEAHLALADVLSRLHETVLGATAGLIERRELVTDQTVDVMFGFDNICRTLAGHPTAKTPSSTTATFELALEPVTGQHPAVPKAARDFAGEGPHQTWQLIDVSTKGMGLRTNTSEADGIEPGDLLLTRLSETSAPGWILVNVARKKLHRAKAGAASIGGQATTQELRLGAEILSREPIVVEGKCFAATARGDTQTAIFDPTLADDSGASQPDRPIHALYLPGDADDARTDSLLFAIDELGASNMLELSSPAGVFTVRLSRVVRKGGRWISYRFDVLSQRPPH
jgi:hypothetical protein